VTSQERSRATKARLLDVAGELVELHGPDHFPIDEVCRRAGLSKATFYYNFPTKEALLEELAESGAPLQRWFEHALASEMSTRALVEAVLRMFVGAIARLPQQEVRRFVLERVTDSVTGTPVRWLLRENLVAVVERGSRRGDVPPSWNPHEAGTAIFGVVLATVIEWLARGEDAAPGDLAPLLLGRVRLVVDQLEPAAGAAGPAREPVSFQTEHV
jgi:AcrR family transcriptional regulator